MENWIPIEDSNTSKKKLILARQDDSEKRESRVQLSLKPESGPEHVNVQILLLKYCFQSYFSKFTFDVFLLMYSLKDSNGFFVPSLFKQPTRGFWEEKSKTLEKVSICKRQEIEEEKVKGRTS
jgi:hypothetical protein